MTAAEKAKAACAPPLTVTLGGAVESGPAPSPPSEDPLVDEEGEEASARPLPRPPATDDTRPAEP